ncbi:MAG: MBL fold metallo-hydrolase [Chloroflexota bacterium]
MNLRFVTLNENTASRNDLIAEWGLSILIESEEGNILLDTGATTSVCHNAQVLGVDLKKIDKIVLSHAHRDHTGGLRELLHLIKKKEIEVVAHPDIWQPKYGRHPEEGDRYSGVSFVREELENLGARFNISREPVKLTPHIMTTGEVPMVTDFEQIDARLFVRTERGLEPDKLMDDLAIVITTEDGLIVVSGCAHRGIVNTIYQAQKVTGVKKVKMVIGGTHLIRTSPERIKKTIAVFIELGLEKIGVSHCTGMPAAVALSQAFGEKFFFNNAGTITKFPFER